MTETDAKVRHTPLPRGRVAVDRPPTRAPWLLVGVERFPPHTSYWNSPQDQQISTAKTLVDYTWPTARVVNGRISFGLWTRLLPSWLVIAYHHDRESARRGALPDVVTDVMAGEGAAQITRTGSRCEIEVDAPDRRTPFLRVELGYDLSEMTTERSCEAAYLLRVTGAG